MLVAVYDGDCVICQSTRQTFQSLDWRRRIEFVDLHDRAGWSGRFPGLSEDALMGEIHVIDAPGTIYTGFQATRRMLKEIPLGWPFWLLSRIPGMNALGERMYRLIARNRYGINRLLGRPLPNCVDGQCTIPD
jgi:predicted DCC family thiol-disulfide oxidoreductase YuxK